MLPLVMLVILITIKAPVCVMADFIEDLSYVCQFTPVPNAHVVREWMILVVGDPATIKIADVENFQRIPGTKSCVFDDPNTPPGDTWYNLPHYISTNPRFSIKNVRPKLPSGKYHAETFLFVLPNGDGKTIYEVLRAPPYKDLPVSIYDFYHPCTYCSRSILGNMPKDSEDVFGVPALNDFGYRFQFELDTSAYWDMDAVLSAGWNIRLVRSSMTIQKIVTGCLIPEPTVCPNCNPQTRAEEIEKYVNRLVEFMLETLRVQSENNPLAKPLSEIWNSYFSKIKVSNARFPRANEQVIRPDKFGRAPEIWMVSLYAMIKHDKTAVEQAQALHGAIQRCYAKPPPGPFDDPDEQGLDLPAKQAALWPPLGPRPVTFATTALGMLPSPRCRKPTIREDLCTRDNANSGAYLDRELNLIILRPARIKRQTAE